MNIYSFELCFQIYLNINKVHKNRLAGYFKCAKYVHDFITWSGWKKLCYNSLSKNGRKKDRSSEIATIAI